MRKILLFIILCILVSSCGNNTKEFRRDVFLPDDTYSLKMTFITPRGLYISGDNIYNPTYSEDYMRFRLFTLEKKR